MKDKKALSLIVSYVLIIVIVVSLAGVTYTYLKYFVPLDSPECPRDISLSIYNYTCDNGVIKIIFQNDGLFNVSSAYIRLGKEGREVRPQINNGDEYFPKGPLAPEQIMSNPLTFQTSSVVTENKTYVLEIQPAVYIKGQFVACEKSLISEKINCET